MERYWDLIEREKANLEGDRLEAFRNVELMEKGAPVVGPPTMQDVPEVEEIPSTTYFKVVTMDGKYSSPEDVGDMVFSSMEAAQAFIETQPLKSEYSYEVGEEYRYAKPYTRLAVEKVNLYNFNDLGPLKEKIIEKKRVKKSNEDAQSDFSKIVREREEALNAFNEDIADCRQKLRRVEEVSATFFEYVDVAGDKDTAGKFLYKAYEGRENRIDEAVEWNELDSSVRKHAPGDDAETEEERT